MNTITQQLEVADEILYHLEKISPYCILAGGAPRDWYMGKPANDLDIYFSLDPENTMEEDICMLDNVLPKGVKQVKSEYSVNANPLYKHMPNLRRIYYFEYKGIQVQLIRLHKKSHVYNAVDTFDCSICKAWYKSGTINLTSDFRRTMVSKVMYLTGTYTWEDYHPKKIKDMFSDYMAGTKEQCILRLVAEATHSIPSRCIP